MIRPLRIAQAAPPSERVPPEGYGGTERVVYELIGELDRRGHEVTLFASGDSDAAAALIPTVPHALRPAGHGGDISGYMVTTMLEVLRHEDEFDLIHSHLEWYSLALQRAVKRPLVATWHGRLDLPWSRQAFADNPPGQVAISQSQAAVHPNVDWSIVHNGLALAGAPYERRRNEDLVFVGRVTPEKGIVEAIEIAVASDRHLKIAAKVGPTPKERQFDEAVFRPALKAAGSAVEFLGELSGDERDALFASSYAVLMPGSWPEPFGLVAIEALACGTPVIARRVGGLDEIIRDGQDGFFGDDVTELAFLVDRVADLDRMAIRESVIDRFSAARMADGYEAVYARMLGLEGDDAPAASSDTSDGDDPSDRSADGASPTTSRVVELRREVATSAS